MKRLFIAALLLPTVAIAAGAPQFTAPAPTDNSNYGVTSSWVRGQGFIATGADASGAKVTPTGGSTPMLLSVLASRASTLEDYGVPHDGTTDASTAMNAAFAAACPTGGGSIRSTPGSVYYVNAVVTVPSYCKWDGSSGGFVAAPTYGYSVNPALAKASGLYYLNSLPADGDSIYFDAGGTCSKTGVTGSYSSGYIKLSANATSGLTSGQTLTIGSNTYTVQAASTGTTSVEIHLDRTTSITNGQAVSGTGIAGGTTVASVTSGTISGGTLTTLHWRTSASLPTDVQIGADIGASINNLASTISALNATDTNLSQLTFVTGNWTSASLGGGAPFAIIEFTEKTAGASYNTYAIGFAASSQTSTRMFGQNYTVSGIKSAASITNWGGCGHLDNGGASAAYTTVWLGPSGQIQYGNDAAISNLAIIANTVQAVPGPGPVNSLLDVANYASRSLPLLTGSNGASGTNELVLQNVYMAGGQTSWQSVRGSRLRPDGVKSDSYNDVNWAAAFDLNNGRLVSKSFYHNNIKYLNGTDITYRPGPVLWLHDGNSASRVDTTDQFGAGIGFLVGNEVGPSFTGNANDGGESNRPPGVPLVDVTNGGSGYQSPYLTFSDSCGTAGFIELHGGVVTNVTITNPGWCAIGWPLVNPRANPTIAVSEVDTATTNASTASGNATLHFAGSTLPNVGAIRTGYKIADLTTPSAITAGTTVSTVSGGTITMSAVAAGAVASGDTIQFTGGTGAVLQTTLTKNERFVYYNNNGAGSGALKIFNIGCGGHNGGCINNSTQGGFSVFGASVGSTSDGGISVPGGGSIDVTGSGVNIVRVGSGATKLRLVGNGFACGQNEAGPNGPGGMWVAPADIGSLTLAGNRANGGGVNCNPDYIGNVESDYHKPSQGPVYGMQIVNTDTTGTTGNPNTGAISARDGVSGVETARLEMLTHGTQGFRWWLDSGNAGAGTFTSSAVQPTANQITVSAVPTGLAVGSLVTGPGLPTSLPLAYVTAITGTGPYTLTLSVSAGGAFSLDADQLTSNVLPVSPRNWTPGAAVIDGSSTLSGPGITGTTTITAHDQLGVTTAASFGTLRSWNDGPYIINTLEPSGSAYAYTTLSQVLTLKWVTAATEVSLSAPTGVQIDFIGEHVQPVATSLTAAGTTQGTALALAAGVSTLTTVASGSGVLLPSIPVGDAVFVLNRGTNALLVYPPTGGKIESAATNAGASLAANGQAHYLRESSTQWRQY